MQLNAKGFIIVRKALKKATYFLFANELSSRLKRVFHHLIKQKQNRVQINQFLNFCEFLLPTFPSHRRKLLTEEYLPNHTTIAFLSMVIFSNTIFIKQFQKFQERQNLPLPKKSAGRFGKVVFENVDIRI